MPELSIKNVALISVGPARGHVDAGTKKAVFVDPTTLDEVFASLQASPSLKVREDHTSTVRNTLGYANNFRRDANKITGDLYFYENTEAAPLFVEIAEKNPDHLGLSLEFSGADEETPDMMLARCFAGTAGVRAVALVSDPAANKSLFSALQSDNKLTNNTTMAETPVLAPKTAGGTDDCIAGLTSQLAALTGQYTALQTEFSAMRAKMEEGKQPADQVKLSEDDAKKVAEFTAKETIKHFAAHFGAVTLKPAGEITPVVAEVTDPVKKFEAHVTRLAAENTNGNLIAARVMAMHKFQADYAATRPVAPRK
jgi:hypothetical protein